MTEKQTNNNIIKNWSNCEFKIGASRIDDIPPTDVPEIAFAGRSNVGKSSLINALTNRNKLVRTSRTPGCTKQLNFFLLDEKFMLVDMPGYGYARQSKETIAGWNKTIQNYLAGRVQLKRVFLLIDSRRGLQDKDKTIMDLLDDKAVLYQVVLTKIDKTPKGQLKKLIDQTKKIGMKHGAMHPEILGTSSARKLGLDDLKNEILGLI